MKLTIAQERALSKLSAEWKSSYCLQESLATLSVLCKRGLSEARHELGSIVFPRTSILFRLKAEQEPTEQPEATKALDNTPQEAVSFKG